MGFLHVWHHWSTWGEPYKARMKSLDDSKLEYVQTRQQRNCTVCRKVQVRIVWRGRDF